MNEQRKCEGSSETIAAMLRDIDEEVGRFVVPILVGKTIELEATSLHSGTGTLVRNGLHLLVTCNHIWEWWREALDGNPGAFVVLLGSGYTALEIEPGAIYANSEADVAAVQFPLTQLTDSQNAFYPLDEIGYQDARVGETLIAVGYPGMWRESSHNHSAMRYSLFPFTVTDVATRGFVAAEAANTEVLVDLDKIAADLGRARDALGGLSGAPVFDVCSRPFKLVGFVRERGSGGVFFAHARSLIER